MSKKRPAGDGEAPAYTKSKKSRIKISERVLTGESPQKLRNEDYTVGWICAITTEYVAAQAFLDERHDRPEYVHSNDHNDYTLGRVGKHNVVIAVLPDGEYGISSARGVASDMLHSFPNVRIGLMVGIGGGAPSPKHDIRLGDIVVSASRDGKGSVFQYDFGKTIQGQSFQPTGFLNQPPIVLRTAMNGLKALYESDGHQFDEAINNILEKKPRLWKKYGRPCPDSDRLYQSTVTHPPNNEANCSVVCGDNLLNLTPRHKRAKDEDNPAIHYGLVASANQLMKDALLRDKLAKENGVLCFEMEAAGLMNKFPCLVIRGICDYSDTHKNKEWQGYAAMAAAAYAKDLLYRIPPNKVEAERRIRELLSDVCSSVSGIEVNVEKMIFKLDREEDLKILNWLTHIDYSSQQTDYIRKREAGTGKWLLESSEYQAWLKTSGQTLFCPGIPGAGKTILTSIVVNDLRERFQGDVSIGIAYLYCDFRRQDEQKFDHLLASLLKQFAEHFPSLPENVKGLYNRHKVKQTTPSLEEMSSTLRSLTAMYSRAFIVVDALDECQTSNGCRVKLLSELFNIQTRHGANILATSRFAQDITKKFEGKTCLEIRATDEDVQKYLASQMNKLPSFVLSSSDLQNNIKTTIAKIVNGMFLLARLHIDALTREPTVGDIELALQNLPRGLDETYDQAMIRIEGQGGGFRDLAKKVLCLVFHAKRVLSTAELQHAVAVKIGKPKLDEKFIPTIEIIGSICAGLITIDTQSDVIRLVHYTTQEYFKQTSERWFPDAEIYITTTCITYLSFNVFGAGFCKTWEDFEERLRLYPLYDYAAHNWGHHAREASTSTRDIMEFLGSKAKVEASGQAMLVSKRLRYTDSQDSPEQVTGLHLTAYFQLENVARLLLDGDGPDLRDSHGRTPLSWAAERGHRGVVQLLLEKGADANLKDKDKMTPLMYAAMEGHETVAKLLLEKGADIKLKDSKYGWTPLSWAAAKGHEATVQLLLEKGAEIESKDGESGWIRVRLPGRANVRGGLRGRTPLSLAARGGYEAVVKLLLENGAETESKDGSSGVAPLSLAVQSGYLAIVQLLLEKGADIDSKARDGRTPLLWAAEGEHEAVVQLLLEKGADVDSKDEYNRTPLSWAAEVGCEAVVKQLLEKGADADSKDKYNRTPLMWAAKKGHNAIVQLLQYQDKGRLTCTVNTESSSQSALSNTAHPQFCV